MLARRKDSLDVFRPYEEIQSEMNRLFNNVFRGTGLRSELPSEGMTLAGVDIYEKDNVIYLEMDLPGMDKKDIDLKIDGNIVTVKGERKYEKEEGTGRSYHICERYYGAIQRSFTVPENIDFEAIKAKYENGVLRIELPRTEEGKKSTKVSVE